MVWLGVLLTVATLGTAMLLGHLDAFGRLCATVWERLHPRRPRSDTVCIEQLSRDLRRLAADIERVYCQDQPAKMARLTAVSLAYDWVLLAAARTLEVPAPAQAPLDSVERLQTEAALAACGLEW